MLPVFLFEARNAVQIWLLLYTVVFILKKIKGFDYTESLMCFNKLNLTQPVTQEAFIDPGVHAEEKRVAVLGKLLFVPCVF